MKRRDKRTRDVILIAVGSVLVGVAAVIGSLAGDTERIAALWTSAEVSASGRADIVEVIDYDFGIARSRHGIFRDVPDLDPEAPISVSSPTAPDSVDIQARRNETRLKIGDPSITIRNRHRYVIEYPLTTLVAGGQVGWNAVGTGWDFPVNRAEIHLLVDFELEAPECSKGRSGDVGGCELVEVEDEPGHWVAEAKGMAPGEGVTVSGRIGAPIETAAQATAPAGPADDPGLGWLVPGLVGLAAAAVAGFAGSLAVLRLGRERVFAGGAADAAFMPDADDIVGVELIDHDELAELATIEFQSPRGLDAAAGGIIHAENVRPDHQVAWLLEAAIRGEVVLDDKTLTRGSADPHPAVAPHLDAMFDDRSSISLDSYDETFGKAWAALGSELEEWRKSSGLWDPAGRRRRTTARILGTLGILVGLFLTALAGVAANRWGGSWILGVVATGVVVGGTVATVSRSWELLVRTPEGSARWLQIESFRRFLEGSEAHHVEAAAEMGLLRHYTAWAVALDEADHWAEVVETAAQAPGADRNMYTSDLAFVAAAPSFAAATRLASTAPSSNGSSGGFSGGGGSVGGGGGGGGGGSW